MHTSGHAVIHACIYATFTTTITTTTITSNSAWPLLLLLLQECMFCQMNFFSIMFVPLFLNF